jgi:hypothetical protein
MNNTQIYNPWRIAFGKILNNENRVICTLPNKRVSNSEAKLLTLAPVLLPLLYTALDALVEHGDETTEPWIREQIQNLTAPSTND